MTRLFTDSTESVSKFEDKADLIVVRHLQNDIRQAIELLLQCHLGQRGTPNFKYIEFTTTNALGVIKTVPKKVTPEQDDALSQILIPFIDSVKLGAVNIDFKYRNGVFAWG